MGLQVPDHGGVGRRTTAKPSARAARPAEATARHLRRAAEQVATGQRVVGRRDAVGRRGRERGQHAGHGHRRQPAARALAVEPQPRDPDQRHRRHHRHRDRQPGRVVGAAQEHQRHHAGRQQRHVEGDHAGQRPRRPAPQRHGARARQRGHGRRQRADVVGVEDALLAAEHDHVDGGPHAEEHPGGAHAIGPRRAARQPQAGEQPDRRNRQQPRDLRPDLLVEHPQQAGRAAEGRPAAARPGTVAAEDPPEAVVAEDQVPDRAVGAAADVGRRPRPDRHRDRPRRAHRDHHRAEQPELPQPPPQRGRPGQQVGRDQRRHDHPALQHLGHERQAHDHAGPDEPLRRPRLERPHEQVRGADEQQHEQRVGVVEAPERDHDRREGQRQRGQQARRGGRERPPHRRVEQAHRRDRHQRLRHEQARAREAQRPHREPEHPQRQRRLVDRDEAARIERAEEPRLPAHAPRLGGRRVVVVAVPADRDVPQAQRGGEQDDGDQRRTDPSRVLGPAAHQRARREAEGA